MRNAKKKKKLQECESNISWKDTAPCLKGFDVEYQVWWFLKDGPITEDGWRMCWSRLPLLVGEGSHLIYLQLPGDSVSILAGWQHSTMQRRESGRRGGSVKDPALRCLFTENGPGGVSLSDIHKHKHTVSHIAPDTSGVCSTHTQAVFTPASPSDPVQQFNAVLQYCYAESSIIHRGFLHLFGRGLDRHRGRNPRVKRLKIDIIFPECNSMFSQLLYPIY